MLLMVGGGWSVVTTNDKRWWSTQTGGHGRDRTGGLFLVRELRYRCATRPVGLKPAQCYLTKTQSAT